MAYIMGDGHGTDADSMCSLSHVVPCCGQKDLTAIRTVVVRPFADRRPTRHIRIKCVPVDCTWVQGDVLWVLLPANRALAIAAFLS
jgi:hypothetical protein